MKMTILVVNFVSEQSDLCFLTQLNNVLAEERNLVRRKLMMNHLLPVMRF